MPIYEYHCETCGADFEVLQKLSDPDPEHHDCSPNSKVKRLLSMNAFQLRGGGWYNEGYAKSGSATQKQTSAPATKEKKSEKKPSKEKTSKGSQPAA